MKIRLSLCVRKRGHRFPPWCPDKKKGKKKSDRSTNTAERTQGGYRVRGCRIYVTAKAGVSLRSSADGDAAAAASSASVCSRRLKLLLITL